MAEGNEPEPYVKNKDIKIIQGDSGAKTIPAGGIDVFDVDLTVPTGYTKVLDVAQVNNLFLTTSVSIGGSITVVNHYGQSQNVNVKRIIVCQRQ